MMWTIFKSLIYFCSVMLATHFDEDELVRYLNLEYEACAKVILFPLKAIAQC